MQRLVLLYFENRNVNFYSAREETLPEDVLPNITEFLDAYPNGNVQVTSKEKDDG